MLRGNYPAKVDEKGRLKIPVVFLEQLMEQGEEFYVTSISGDRARIYPMKVWQGIEEQLSRVSVHNETKQKFLLRANYYGQAVKLDKQGRLLIPPVLRAAAAIKGEVDVMGNLSYLEVWNHERWLKFMNENPFTSEDSKILDAIG